jgi:hypothetical protein
LKIPECPENESEYFVVPFLILILLSNFSCKTDKIPLMSEITVAIKLKTEF